MKSTNARPKMDLPASKTEIALSMAAGALLIAMTAYAFGMYFKLPSVIPTHFDFIGNADGFGDRLSVFAIPAVALLLFAGLTVLQKYPHVFNYPCEVREDNARYLYKNGRLLLSYMKAEMVLIFAFLEYTTVSEAMGNRIPMLMPLLALLGVLLATLVVFVFRMVKKT